MKKTTVYLQEELVFAIKDIAARGSRPGAAVIREGLAQYVESRKRPLPSFVGMASDGTIRAADDENYLEEHWKPRGCLG